jgi:nickel/cobalt transporter (NicO) family protein
MMRKLAATLAAAFVLVLIAANFAHAQSPLGIGAAEPSVMPSGLGWQFLSFVNAKQQEFYRLLTGALKAMREDPAKLALLIGLSFAYGIFHAAGPGHGKAVISSYMIANEVQLRRGVLLSFLSSFAQGLTAIAVVGAAYLVLRGTTITMTQATHYMELASYLLIAMFGAWLLWRKLAARFFPTLAPVSHHGHAHDHDHHHHHDHDHDHGHDHEGHAHHAHRTGEVCATCGHSHAPDPAMIAGKDFSVREAWSAVMAVGLRPCSGSLLVLSFSLLNGLLLGGILSVFAISLGTAITVSTLAVLAVLAKDVALKFAGDRRADTVGFVIEIAGASLVLFLGGVLFLAAL